MLSQLNVLHPNILPMLQKNGQEGWVQLSFVIDQQGNVLDPIVEDSSGVKSLEKAVRIAIKNWKFDPAKRNGAAIEQCQMTVQKYAIQYIIREN